MGHYYIPPSIQNDAENNYINQIPTILKGFKATLLCHNVTWMSTREIFGTKLKGKKIFENKLENARIIPFKKFISLAQAKINQYTLIDVHKKLFYTRSVPHTAREVFTSVPELCDFPFMMYTHTVFRERRKAKRWILMRNSAQGYL